MYKDLKFPILIVHRDIKADSVAGERVRAIADELAQDGFAILSTASASEGRIVASTHHGLAPGGLLVFQRRERFNGLKGDTQTVNSLPLPCPSGHSMNWMKLKM